MVWVSSSLSIDCSGVVLRHIWLRWHNNGCIVQVVQPLYVPPFHMCKPYKNLPGSSVHIKPLLVTDLMFYLDSTRFHKDGIFVYFFFFPFLLKCLCVSQTKERGSRFSALWNASRDSAFDFVGQWTKNISSLPLYSSFMKFWIKALPWISFDNQAWEFCSSWLILDDFFSRFNKKSPPKNKTSRCRFCTKR